MVTVQDNVATFQFFRPHARQVYLAGDFNHWQSAQLPMSRQPDGSWVASMRLAPGTYRFRYRADGEWFIDYAAFGVEHGPFGLDGVVRVAERPTGAGKGSRPQACRTCPHVVEAA